MPEADANAHPHHGRRPSKDAIDPPETDESVGSWSRADLKVMDGEFIKAVLRALDAEAARNARLRASCG